MTYTDKKPGFRREYTVDEQSLVITGKKWIGTSFRQEFALSKIKPVPDEHRLKDDGKTAYVSTPGFLLFVVAVCCGTWIYERTSIGFYVILAGSAAAMITGFVFGGRMRVYVFKSLEETPLFDIPDRDGRSGDFQAFTQELQARIRSAAARAPTR